MSETESMPVVHNQEGHRFEVILEGRHSQLQYVMDADTMFITHVGVHPELRGQQLAGRLMQAGLEYARANGLRVVPQCAYANAYMRRHPENDDLLKGRK